MKTLRPPDLSRLHALRDLHSATRHDLASHRDRFDRLANRHSNGSAPRAVVARQLFQTPPALAARLVALLPPVEGLAVLEPSAGLGRLLDALAPRSPGEVVAVDASPDCCAELRRRDGLTVHCGDFLAMQPEALGMFDAIVMNPPFTMRSDIKHILHATRFLMPGGTLAALCMDTPHRHAALHGMAATWEQIPAGTFRAEGTDVPTILLSIVK